jgi:putative hydrolase of HD superfamily
MPIKPTSLENLEKFLQLLHDVQRVQRIARRPDEQELTSTAEHTFELVMACWYIMHVNNLALDYEKVFKYALAHDVVEAYAGDTPNYDVEARTTKERREKEALERIEAEFPDFGELTSIIREYENRQTPEARFVYALDKLIDPLDSSMETTQSIWKDYDMSWNAFVSYKEDKIAHSDVIFEYWKMLKQKLAEKRKFFFDK